MNNSLQMLKYLLILTFFHFLVVFSFYAQMLPDWSENTKFESDSNSNEIIVSHFLATWCQPCMQELPIFDSIANSHLYTIHFQFIVMDFENTRSLYKKMKRLGLPGSLYYLSPKIENQHLVTDNWNGILPFTAIQFPNEQQIIELYGKQTSASIIQFIKDHEN
ncbi:MAG TPA: hypothetical protein DEF82_01040 [Crocinitomicaceae bacterium]|nr:hypothetical protein [Flavobacteriales bacterium]HBW85365.1 hypothetical protein [Crocinitomicaceae bacterium]